jgi:hypothetical protein
MKNRNGTCNRELQFRVVTRELGDDDDGDQITAALAIELEPGTGRTLERLTASEQNALRILTEMLEAQESETVSNKLWRDKCIDGSAVSVSDTEDSRRTAIDRTVKGLAPKDRIEVTKDTVRLRRQRSDSGDDSGAPRKMRFPDAGAMRFYWSSAKGSVGDGPDGFL